MATLRYNAEEFREIADASFGWGDPMTAYHLLLAAADDLEVREACACDQRSLPDYTVDQLREQAAIYGSWSRYRNGSQIAALLHQAADDLDADQCRADAQRYRRLRATRSVPDAWLAPHADQLSPTDLDAQVDALSDADHDH